ncbi:MAG: guanylate kinase [Myxococcota bacterium]
MSSVDLLLLIVSSPSGAGKTTLTRRLLKQFPELTFSVSHTTRKRRPTEVDGKDYQFVDRPTFEAMVERNEFAEWAEVHGNLYGTSKGQLDRAREEGMHGIVFDVDHQGARQIHAAFPHAVGVFILPPSMPELLSRLRRRAEDDEATIRRRYQKALYEIEHYPFFDYIVVNEELERADAMLQGIVYAERSRRWRAAGLAEQLLRAQPMPE